MTYEDLSQELALDRHRPVYRRPVAWAIVGVLIFVFWFVPWIPRLYSDAILVTRLDAKGKPIEVEVGPKTKQWVHIAGVSKHLIHAIVVAEDGKFYEHHGFDFDAIKKAYALNQKKGKFARGGSTISQQVVKMAFLSREKTYTRKLREAAGTVFMELLLPKDKILEWYINMVEFGGGIYGVKQAGQHYFKTRPDLLTTEQAIHLALVIPSPNKWSIGLKKKNLTPFGHKRFARIAINLRKSGYISAPVLQTILARGNFGAPIAGYRVTEQADEEDDCKGSEQECSDDDERSKAGKPSTEPWAATDVQEKSASPPKAVSNEPEPGMTPTPANVNVSPTLPSPESSELVPPQEIPIPTPPNGESP